MTIRFSCPHCGAMAHVADEDAGKVASCSRCGNLTRVPHHSAGASAPVPHPNRDVIYIDDRPARRWSKGLLVWLAVGLAALLFAGMLIPAIQYDSPYGGYYGYRHQMKSIGLALINYDVQYGCFPPAYVSDDNGRPMHSWRVLILPYLEQQYLYDLYDFNQPWDSPHNLLLLERLPDVYRYPEASDEEAEAGLTRSVVIIGDPDKYPQTMFTPDRPLTSSEVTDGVPNTLLVVESTRAVPWTMPGADLHYDRMTFRLNGSPESIGGRGTVAFADGSVRELEVFWPGAEDSVRTKLQRMIQPTDGQGEAF